METKIPDAKGKLHVVEQLERLEPKVVWGIRVEVYHFLTLAFLVAPVLFLLVWIDQNTKYAFDWRSSFFGILSFGFGLILAIYWDKSIYGDKK